MPMIDECIVPSCWLVHGRYAGQALSQQWVHSRETKHVNPVKSRFTSINYLFAAGKLDLTRRLHELLFARTLLPFYSREI
jgi:hypothetical protein